MCVNCEVSVHCNQTIQVVKELFRISNKLYQIFYDTHISVVFIKINTSSTSKCLEPHHSTQESRNIVYKFICLG